MREQSKCQEESSNAEKNVKMVRITSKWHEKSQDVEKKVKMSGIKLNCWE